MDWVFDHFQIIVGVAAAIAYFLNQRRQAAAEKEEAGPRQASDATELAERTRRVQEEIRRKIAERRGISPHLPAPAAQRERLPRVLPPLQVPSLDPFGGPMRRSPPRLPEALAPVETRDESAHAAMLQRQAEIAEQLRAMEAARQAEQRRATELSAAAAMAQRQAVAESATELREWRDGLREPAALRRAVVLREVLGPPLALR